MPTVNPDEFRALRMEAKLSQAALAGQAQLNRQTVARAERGENLSGETLKKFQKALSLALSRPIYFNHMGVLGDDADNCTFAGILVREMSKRGLTQAQLASELAVSDRTVSNWLREKSQPSTKILEEIRKKFGLKKAELKNLQNRSGSSPKKMKRMAVRLLSEEADKIRKYAQLDDLTTAQYITDRLGDGDNIERMVGDRKFTGSHFPRERPTELSSSSERRQVQFNIPEHLLEQLDKITNSTGLSRSDLVRQALLAEGNSDNFVGREGSGKTALLNADLPEDGTGRLRMVQTAQSIPDQNPLVRFGVSEHAKLNLIPTLADENDYDTIEALRSELLVAQGPIELLKDRYARNPNVPQAGLFGPLTSKYHEELSKDPKEINYTVLFARGSRFYAARRRAAQQVASHEWPELDADENEAIDAICDLHGPMIMASAAGRKLVEDAHQYEVPPEVYEEDQKTIEEFGRVIAAETKLIEPETAEAFRELTAKTEDDPQPMRSRGLGVAATGSALTVIVGGAAWYGAGGAVATFVVPAAALGAAGLVGGFFWEAIKTMPRFKKASATVGDQFEKVLDKAEKRADDKERSLLKGMADLVERKRPLFEKVANLRPEFGWAKKYLNKKSDHELTIPPPVNKHIVITGVRFSNLGSVGKSLARRLNLSFQNLEVMWLPGATMPGPGKGELDTLRKLVEEPPLLIALGDTFHDYRETWEILAGKATIFVLEDTSPDSVYDPSKEKTQSKLSDISKFHVISVDAGDLTERTVEQITSQLLTEYLL